MLLCSSLISLTVAAWSSNGILQQQWSSADCSCTWMCDGWLWAFCPGAFDHTFLCYKLLWYLLLASTLHFPPQIILPSKFWHAIVSIGTANNAGAILVLGRDLVVVPKLIHPLPPAISSPETSPERHIEDTWMQVLNKYVHI